MNDTVFVVLKSEEEPHVFSVSDVLVEIFANQKDAEDYTEAMNKKYVLADYYWEERSVKKSI